MKILRKNKKPLIQPMRALIQGGLRHFFVEFLIEQTGHLVEERFLLSYVNMW